MALTLREVKGSALTIQEMDDNFRYFTGSHSITGSLTVTAGITANLTGSVLGTAATASFFDVVNYVAGLGEYADDAAAATGGVPVGGLYKNGNFIQIRIV